jgi:hypothetical protein
VNRRIFRARIEAYNQFNHTEFNSIGTTWQLLGSNIPETMHADAFHNAALRVLTWCTEGTP